MYLHRDWKIASLIGVIVNLHTFCDHKLLARPHAHSRALKALITCSTCFISLGHVLVWHDTISDSVRQDLGGTRISNQHDLEVRVKECLRYNIKYGSERFNVSNSILNMPNDGFGSSVLYKEKLSQFEDSNKEEVTMEAKFNTCLLVKFSLFDPFEWKIFISDTKEQNNNKISSLREFGNLPHQSQAVGSIV
ncbi:hypothetical protein ACJX0J_013246 [Zea mays]